MFRPGSVHNTSEGCVQMISITYDDMIISDCTSVLIVPDIAEQEPGYINTLTSAPGTGSKHEFHALAQMAYFQFQDDELEIEHMSSACRIYQDNGDQTLASGLIIFRSGAGTIHILSHQGVNYKKLLEAANRYCTRWVRLDI